MHCYEYLAMHMQLKSELQREFPNKEFNQLDIEEILGSFEISSFMELLIKIEQLHKRNGHKLNFTVASDLKHQIID